MTKSKLTAIGLAVLIATLAGAEAEARRIARGANGVVGAYGRQGAYGGRVGARAFGPNAGASFRAANYAGVNGGAFQGGNVGGYKRGVGAARASRFNATGPNGASASGYSNNIYNAQTASGVRNSGKSLTTAEGQSYGYDGTTTYTKGAGATTSLDTQNKGDYTIDWQKGAKPVVTPTVP